MTVIGFTDGSSGMVFTYPFKGGLVMNGGSLVLTGNYTGTFAASASITGADTTDPALVSGKIISRATSATDALTFSCGLDLRGDLEIAAENTNIVFRSDATFGDGVALNAGGYVSVSGTLTLNAGTSVSGGKAGDALKVTGTSSSLRVCGNAENLVEIGGNVEFGSAVTTSDNCIEYAKINGNLTNLSSKDISLQLKNTSVAGDFSSRISGISSAGNTFRFDGNVSVSGAVRLSNKDRLYITGENNAIGGIDTSYIGTSADIIQTGTLTLGESAIQYENYTLEAGGTLNVSSGSGDAGTVTFDSTRTTLLLAGEVNGNVVVSKSYADLSALTGTLNGNLTVSNLRNAEKTFLLDGTVTGTATVQGTSDSVLALGANSDVKTVVAEGGSSYLTQEEGGRAENVTLQNGASARIGGQVDFLAISETSTAQFTRSAQVASFQGTGTADFAAYGISPTFEDGMNFAGTVLLRTGTARVELGKFRGTAANVRIGNIIATDGSASNAASGAAGVTIIHDLYEDGGVFTADKLTTSADLSQAVALIRGNDIDVSALEFGSVTLTLLEGTGNGYGSILTENLDGVNVALNAAGTELILSAAGKNDPIVYSQYNRNQRAVAEALSTGTPTGELGTLAEAWTTAGTLDEKRAALDSIGGVALASMLPAQIRATRDLQNALFGAIGTGARLESDANSSLWAQATGAYADIRSSGERIGWNRNSLGATAGFDRNFTENFLAGIAVGFENSEHRSDGAFIDGNMTHFSLYAKHAAGNFEQRFAASVARHEYDVRRNISAGTAALRAEGDADGLSLALDYEAAWRMELTENFALLPVARVSAAWNRISDWSEKSAGTAAISFDSQNALTGFAGAGVRAEFSLPNPASQAAPIRVSAEALLSGEFGERSDRLCAAFSGTGSRFALDYDETDALAVQIGAGASMPLSRDISVYGGVSADFREKESGFSANLGVRCSW